MPEFDEVILDEEAWDEDGEEFVAYMNRECLGPRHYERGMFD